MIGKRLRIATTAGLIVLVFALLGPPSAPAHVVKKWDWHLLASKKKKRHIHWCVVFQLRPGMKDAFPRGEADKWKKWAKEAFDNWQKALSKKKDKWTFKEVQFYSTKPKCQIQIRWSTTPRSDYGRASVPDYEKGENRAETVQIYIHGVDAKKKSRKFGRKGADTYDPVRLLMHEIGHAIRLDDTKNPKDIMSSGVEKDDKERGNHITELTKEDIKEAGDSAAGELEVAMLPSEPDVGGALATALPTAPVVSAYLYMAVDAHDRYQDLDASEDWLERALELDPYNRTARAMLGQVKEEKQQVGLQRMGVALTVLKQMMEKLEEEEEEQEEGDEELEGEEELPEGGD
jgi:tetratricopeptide (TPR) repeat protein